ncbi:Aerobic respiration control sensor protein arcB [Klebsiella pneumoniae]|uniref:Aerobic respiration control sensor protein arcB n=1 Tax=Klebsiella pneumoniae TaxID=573 RepID=A0A2X3CI95_KLEPN|nr:Aerobic respiration control sensor protein arcB [Klebsiella pneumoniae]
MKQIRMLAQYYVDLMMKLGLVRFFDAVGSCAGGAGHRGTDGGYHGAAWPG